MKTIEIKIYDIIKLSAALSTIQAEEVKKELKFPDSDFQCILDFKNINDATTAFMNAILDSFFLKVKSHQELSKILKIKNSNESIKFAYSDAFKLFKERF